MLPTAHAAWCWHWLDNDLSILASGSRTAKFDELQAGLLKITAHGSQGICCRCLTSDVVRAEQTDEWLQSTEHNFLHLGIDTGRADGL